MGAHEKILYHCKLITIGEIARLENVHPTSLKTAYVKLGDIYRAVEQCKKNKIYYN